MDPVVTGESLDTILEAFRGQKGALLAVLHNVQEAYGYIPKEAVSPIARCLGMGVSTVYGILTFYSEFRTEPPPEKLIDMCLGPTCHLRGAQKIRKILEVKLGIDKEGRNHDNRFGIHIVQCSGLCHLAPLLYINDQVKGRVKVAQAAKLAQEITES